MFEDIFNSDIFDFDDDKTKEEKDREAMKDGVSEQEKDSGIWNTGQKEDIWRSGGNAWDSAEDPSDAWDANDEESPTVAENVVEAPCEETECENCTNDCDEAIEDLSVPEEVASGDLTGDPGCCEEECEGHCEPAAEQTQQESSGLFDDII